MTYALRDITYRSFIFSMVGIQVFLFVIWVGVSSVSATNDVVSEYFEEKSPQIDWYVYHGAPRPHIPDFEAGQPLKFQSVVEYHQDIQVQWQDTLFCLQDGGKKKYATQYWPPEGYEFRPAGATVNFNPELPEFWEYSIEQPDPQASECQICGVVVGLTSNGHFKNYPFCTEWFGVNK